VSDRAANDEDRTRLIRQLDHRYRSPLLTYFDRRVRNRAEAEDLTQEVLIRLANHPDRNGGATIDSYVFTIAVNLLRDRAKSPTAAREREHQSLSEYDRTLEPPSLVEDRTPERVLLARETLQDVIEALGELAERTRDIFILSRLENVHHREIAALHGISVSAVEKHMIKALAHLGARFLRP